MTHPDRHTVKILRTFVECGGLAALKTDILRLASEVDPEEHRDPHDPDSQPAIPIRLRYYEPIGFYVNTGDSSYDQDHRGCCSANEAWLGMTEEEAEEVARRMLDEILEQAAEDRAWRAEEETAYGPARGWTRRST